MKKYLMCLLDDFPIIKKMIRRNWRFLISVRVAIKKFMWLKSYRIKKIIKNDLKKSFEKVNLSKAECDNKIVIICISRDENVLLDQWIKHHQNLQGICAIAVVDHLSAFPIEIKANVENNLIDYYGFRFSNSNYFQAHILNSVSRNLLSRYPNAIFFPLDTDEFIGQETINNIRKSSEKYGYFDWRMSWPIDIFCTKDSNEISIFEKLYSTVSYDFLGNKHFMRSSLLFKGYQWGQAAHEVYNRYGFIRKALKFGSMVHLPVRSFEQINTKFSRGFEAHRDNALNYRDEDGDNVFTKHWKIIPELLSDQEAMLKDAILRYLPTGSEVIGTSSKTWIELFEND